MPKRYTDTEKWKKKWFRILTPEEKTAWFFITEQCDNVGVWDGDTEAAEFNIGAKIDWDSFLKRINENIEVLEDGKWWLIDYCAFQHTDLSPDSKSIPVISYIKLLKKHNLYERVMKGFAKPLDSLSKGLKEKEKVKVKVKVKVKAKAKEKAKEKETFGNEVLEYYKQLTGKIKITKIPGQVGERLNEGHTVEEGKKVILYKYLEWWNTPKMRSAVNLTTLFRPLHFEEYLSQAEQGLDEVLNRQYKQYKKQLYDEHQNAPQEVRRTLKIPTFEEFKKEKLGEMLNGE